MYFNILMYQHFYRGKIGNFYSVEAGIAFEVLKPFKETRCAIKQLLLLPSLYQMLYFVKAQWLPSKVGYMAVIYQWLMIAAFISLCFIMTVLPRSVLGLVMCRIAGTERNRKAALKPRGIKLRLIIYQHTTGDSGTHFMFFHAASPQSNAMLRQGQSPRSSLRLSGLIKARLAEESAFANFLAFHERDLELF